jgi:hypothetical protein
MGFWDLVIIALFCFIAISSVVGSFGIPSDGVATDTIARISDAGLIWKTWRVQLTNDHPIATSSGTNQMQYGVEKNETLLAKLQQYADSGERVKLYYRGKIWVWAWEFSDTEIIYDVKAMN